MFPAHIKHHTFKGADNALRKLKEKREAKELKAKVKQKVKKGCKVAQSMAEKEAQVTELRITNPVTYS